MEISQLHFDHPLWLWAGVALPLVWIVYFLFYRLDSTSHQLEKFIDRHLIPHLLMDSSKQEGGLWKQLILWTTAWSLLTLALAGPRWSFREMETFSKDQNLVILLDLSESMNASDIKPSRLVRAKQKIEDLLNASNGVKVGLIAFAADPHMITPITDDKETIRHLLPTLETDLVYLQGSRLSSALDMSALMLEKEPGSNKSLLVISDGGFEDASAILTAKKLADKGIVIHAMAIGTIEGAPIRDHAGNLIQKNGVPVVSKLEKERFREISKTGNGRYFEAHYADRDEEIILEELEKRAESQVKAGRKNRIWDERFFVLIIPALPIFLWWFRKGVVFASLVMLFLPFAGLQADGYDYFKNSDQQAQQAVDLGEYEAAARLFQDPYRKGVACYKAGDFAEAEKLFRQSSRDEVAASAAYNIGNTLVKQEKLKKAITAYEAVLKKWPDHVKAKENLEIVKKILDQQEQQGEGSDNSDQNKDQEKKDQEKEDQDNGGQSEQGEGEKNKSDCKEPEDKKGSNNSEGGKSDKPEEREEENELSDGKEDSIESEDEGAESEGQQKSQEGSEKATSLKEEEGEYSASQEDQDADLWLNRIYSDPKAFMKNKFYIESKKNAGTEGMDPW